MNVCDKEQYRRIIAAAKENSADATAFLREFVETRTKSMTQSTVIRVSEALLDCQIEEIKDRTKLN